MDMCCRLAAAALFALAATAGATAARADLSVGNLRCEYAVDPLGIDAPNPRLNWVLTSSVRGQRQTAYQVLVATSKAALKPGQADLWDSGKVTSDQSANVHYAGKPLTSRQGCYWAVRAWDKDGAVSAFSKPAYWEMGLLQPSDWTARWISGGKRGACPFFRKEFAPAKPVKSARLYSSALGVYYIHVNGQRVSGDVFAPGWTDYHKRVQYQTYDVTKTLKSGRNALGIVLGPGWYCGYVGLGGPERYGSDTPMARAQLVIDYTDGSHETVATDGSWKTVTGPILASDMLMGEDYDARREMPGWDKPGFNEGAWGFAQVGDNPVAMDAQRGPAVRKTVELAAKAITQPKPGQYIFDIGQNMVGWARLRVHGAPGTTVTLRFAEMLNPDGTLYTTNYRGAKCTDHYTLKGVASGAEVYEPSFTFRGFRYVEVTGYPGEPKLNAITGVVTHSDMAITGSFVTDNPLVNQLQHNIQWGQRGNFLSIPTDCPQRDERLGWTGDAQIFCRTAAYNMDVAGFFTKWLVDLDDAQRPNGAYPHVAPYVFEGYGSAAWGDAGVICPWTMYLMYNDKQFLADHYDNMARWVEYCREHSNNLLRPDEGYGDWLSINADTPKDVYATAYFAYSTSIVAKSAAILGKTDDAKKYNDLFEQIKTAFNKAYVTDDGHIKGNTQTCFLMGLRFNLLPEEKRAAAARYLVEDIQKRDWHLSTGFVGVGYLLPTLTDINRNDVAFRLLLQDSFPSWFYSIKRGATTIWERWDGWTNERGFQDPGMNSFNHYSLGSVGQWMFETAGGIGLDMQNPGFKHIIVRPAYNGPFPVTAQYDSVYGRIAVQQRGGQLKVTVPVNTTATIYLPSNAAADDRKSPDAKLAGTEGGQDVVEVGSGTYTFTIK